MQLDPITVTRGGDSCRVGVGRQIDQGTQRIDNGTDCCAGRNGVSEGRSVQSDVEHIAGSGRQIGQRAKIFSIEKQINLLQRMIAIAGVKPDGERRSAGQHRVRSGTQPLT